MSFRIFHLSLLQRISQLHELFWDNNQERENQQDMLYHPVIYVFLFSVISLDDFLWPRFV